MLALLCLSFVAGALGAPTSCNRICTAQYSPVCGSNGKTYSNSCLLNEASCQYQQGGGQRVYQVHTGTCFGGGLLGGTRRTCDQICDEVKSPICASDGVVYENRCRFELAQCEASNNGTRLSIVSFTSTCPTPTDPNCEKYSVNTTDIAVEGPLGDAIKIVCPHGGHEVCTNQGTYQSECQLCQVLDALLAKYQNMVGYRIPDYKILYEGPCHKGSSYAYPGGPFLGGSGIPMSVNPRR